MIFKVGTVWRNKSIIYVNIQAHINTFLCKSANVIFSD